MRIRRSPLALLALLLTGALIAGCGGDDTSGGGSAAAAGGGGGNAQDASALLKSTFSKEKAVTSGEIALKGSAEFKGDDDLQGPLKLSLRGPFSFPKGGAPLLDWTVQVTGMGQSIGGKLTVTKDNAYVGLRGQTYEVGAKLYNRYVGPFEKALSSGGATSFADLGLEPQSWLDDARISTGPTIGGSATRKITGRVKVEKMVRDLVNLTKSSAFKRQLRAQRQAVPTVSESDIKKVIGAIRDPSFEVAVDGDEHLRRVAFSSGIKRPSGETRGPKSGKIGLRVDFPKIGGTPAIEAPSGAKPIQLLFQQLFGALQGARGTGALQTN